MRSVTSRPQALVPVPAALVEGFCQQPASAPQLNLNCCVHQMGRIRALGSGTGQVSDNDCQVTTTCPKGQNAGPLHFFKRLLQMSGLCLLLGGSRLGLNPPTGSSYSPPPLLSRAMSLPCGGGWTQRTARHYAASPALQTPSALRCLTGSAATEVIRRRFAGVGRK